MSKRCHTVLWFAHGGEADVVIVVCYDRRVGKGDVSIYVSFEVCKVMFRFLAFLQNRPEL